MVACRSPKPCGLGSNPRWDAIIMEYIMQIDKNNPSFVLKVYEVDDIVTVTCDELGFLVQDTSIKECLLKIAKQISLFNLLEVDI